MHRRSLVLSIGSAGLLMAGRSTFLRAQSSDDLDYEDFDGPLPSLVPFGTNPPTEPEQAQAYRILRAAPRNKSLLETAGYFESITERNTEGEHFNAAWRERWNPVIVQFYKVTQLSHPYVLERGDTIPWCAAFLNWCLDAAGLAVTSSASSSSFRTYGSETEHPRPGDVVVFKHANRRYADVGRGHVGIFAGMEGQRIRVLGGNQKAGKKYSSVCFSAFPKISDALVLHSFRRPTRA